MPNHNEDPVNTGLVDAALIHAAMKQCHGRVSAAAQLLGMTQMGLAGLIRKHRELNALWNEKMVEAVEVNPLSMIVTSGADLDDPERQKLIQAALASVTEVKSVAAMRGSGMDDKQIAQFLSFSEFAGSSMQGILAASHGALAYSLMLIPKRLDEIQKILDNNEIVDTPIPTRDGVEMVKMPKYSAEMKAAFSREYRELLALQVKITDTCNNTAALHLKAKELPANEKQKPRPKLKNATPA